MVTKKRRAGRHLRRDRRLTAVALVVGLGAAAAVGGQLALAAPPPEPVVAATIPEPVDGVLDLGFAGDTMLADAATDKLSTEGAGAVLAGVAPLLADFDYTIINAETPFTTSPLPGNPGAKYSYATDPAYLTDLKAVGVDALGFGNNHAMDRGAIGLTDSLTHADAAGLAAFGAGVDRADASMPLLVTAGDTRIAVVSFGENFGQMHRSSDVAPGMVPLKPDRVERALRVAEDNGADRVVAFVHWGDNYQAVNDQQRYWASVFRDAGYDAVIGSGSHTLQTVELVGDMPVVYGLGNFVFGAPGRFASYGQLGLGAVVGLRWGSDGVGTITMRVITTDNAVVEYVPRPADAAELAAAQLIIGGAVTWDGDVGTLRF